MLEPGKGTLVGESAEHLAALEVLDSVAWAHDRPLPELEITHKVEAAAIHPTCATHRQGHAWRLGAPRRGSSPTTSTSPADGQLLRLRRRPRHLPHPELTASATRAEASEVTGAAAALSERRFDAYLSSNRTCEIGMTLRHRPRVRVGDQRPLERATR